jgi:hypothetical protein
VRGCSSQAHGRTGASRWWPHRASSQTHLRSKALKSTAPPRRGRLGVKRRGWSHQLAGGVERPARRLRLPVGTGELRAGCRLDDGAAVPRDRDLGQRAQLSSSQTLRWHTLVVCTRARRGDVGERLGGPERLQFSQRPRAERQEGNGRGDAVRLQVRESSKGGRAAGSGVVRVGLGRVARRGERARTP